jgi:hypothetical protein
MTNTEIYPAEQMPAADMQQGAEVQYGTELSTSVVPVDVAVEAGTDAGAAENQGEIPAAAAGAQATEEEQGPGRWDRIKQTAQEWEIPARVGRVAAAAGAGALIGAGVLRQGEDGRLQPMSYRTALATAAKLYVSPRGTAISMARSAAAGAREHGRKAVIDEAKRAWHETTGSSW